MKKTFRKLTSVLLVTLVISLMLPLQSFAAVKIPVIESVEITEDSQAVSLKEVESYFEYIFEFYEKYEVNIEDYLGEISSDLLDNILKFHLYSSGFEYKFDVTLASGKKHTVSSKDYDSQINKLYGVEIDAFITYESYLKAKEEGADEIQAEIYARLYNNLTYDYFYSTAYTSVAALPLTREVVKNITPLSGIPEKLYRDQTYVDIDGAEFLIEYADGRTVTATAKADSESNRYFGEFTLDGEVIEVYYDFPEEYEEEAAEQSVEFYFNYLDASCQTTAVYVGESLLKGIKITDCVFDAENLHLSSLAYELTYADERTASFTKEFSSEEEVFSDVVTWLDNVDGYVVKLFVSLGDFDEDSEEINADAYYFTVSAGEVSDTYKVDNPYKDAMNVSLNVAYFFINIITKIQDFFYNFFDMIFFAV